MANHKSKFDQLHESAFSRYTQGAGFLAGDVVKFKKKVTSSEWFKGKATAFQELVLTMMKSDKNLRIGILTKESPHAIGGHGANEHGPSELADIYLELSPANWAYPMTVPLALLDRVEPKGSELAPIPDSLRDKERVQKKGAKGKADKETKIDDSNRQTPTKNASIPGGKKWDDSKVGGGNAQNLPGTGLKESVDSLENAYGEVLQESTNPGSVKKVVKLAIVRLPATEEWRVSYLVNGRLDDDKSYYTNDKKDAEDTRDDMLKRLKAAGTITEAVLQDSFNSCQYSEEGGNVTVTFEDTVYSSLHNDEIPVTVSATFQQHAAQALNHNVASWDLLNLSIVDERGQAVNLKPVDSEYLTNRANDFVAKYKDHVGEQKALTGVVDEALGNPNSVQVDGHTITHSKYITKGADPTAMNTWKFDNGYSVVEFFGDYELKDPSGNRIKHVTKTSDLNKALHHLGLPLFDKIEAAFDTLRQTQNSGEQEPPTGWDPNP